MHHYMSDWSRNKPRLGRGNIEMWLCITCVKQWLKTVNLLSTNPTKLSNILKQFVGKLPTNCLRVYYDFVGLALEGLNIFPKSFIIDVWQGSVYASDSCCFSYGKILDLFVYCSRSSCKIDLDEYNLGKVEGLQAAMFLRFQESLQCWADIFKRFYSCFRVGCF